MLKLIHDESYIKVQSVSFFFLHSLALFNARFTIFLFPQKFITSSY